MAHVNHGDIHEIGLQDNCPDCEAHANFPWATLDQEMLQQLIKRNYWCRSNNPTSSKNQPRSDTEAYAMVQIQNVMERAGKLFSASPIHIIEYLNKNWGIELELKSRTN